MYLTISKWINILSILLALLAMGELIFTATILFLVSTIICKTGGYMSSICGLIASLVCLPTAFKVRSMYSGYEIRIRHLDMQSYHRIMLYISLGIQTICVLICCVTLTQTLFLQGDFSSAVTKYLQRYSEKNFVDLVQALFQCCGIFSYQDWANLNWISRNKQELFCQGPRHESKWEKFTNCIDTGKLLAIEGKPSSHIAWSNTAELVPTCQEQILLNDAKVQIVSTEEINDEQGETYELMSCSKDELLISRDEDFCCCSSSDEIEITNETFKLVPINKKQTLKKKSNMGSVYMALTRKRVRFK